MAGLSRRPRRSGAVNRRQHLIDAGDRCDRNLRLDSRGALVYRHPHSSTDPSVTKPKETAVEFVATDSSYLLAPRSHSPRTVRSASRRHVAGDAELSLRPRVGSARYYLLDRLRLLHGGARRTGQTARAPVLVGRGIRTAALAAGFRQLGQRRPDDVHARSAFGPPPDVVGDRLLAPMDGAGRPTRHVRCHHEIRQLVEGKSRRQYVGAARRRVVVPGVDDRAGDTTIRQRVEQRVARRSSVPGPRSARPPSRAWPRRPRRRRCPWSPRSAAPRPRGNPPIPRSRADRST